MLTPDQVTNWETEWKKVEFSDSIRVVGINRGRSAANFEAHSTEKKARYTIFMADFLSMVFNRKVKAGAKISGVFRVVKRGRNLGIVLKDIKETKIAHEMCLDRPIPGYI